MTKMVTHKLKIIFFTGGENEGLNRVRGVVKRFSVGVGGIILHGQSELFVRKDSSSSSQWLISLLVIFILLPAALRIQCFHFQHALIQV
jgi:hypothetical protein